MKNHYVNQTIISNNGTTIKNHINYKAPNFLHSTIRNAIKKHIETNYAPNLLGFFRQMISQPITLLEQNLYDNPHENAFIAYISESLEVPELYFFRNEISGNPKNMPEYIRLLTLHLLENKYYPEIILDEISFKLRKIWFQDHGVACYFKKCFMKNDTAIYYKYAVSVPELHNSSVSYNFEIGITLAFKEGINRTSTESNYYASWDIEIYDTAIPEKIRRAIAEKIMSQLSIVKLITDKNDMD